MAAAEAMKLEAILGIIVAILAAVTGYCIFRNFSRGPDERLQPRAHAK